MTMTECLFGDIAGSDQNGSLRQFLIMIFICFYENVLYHDKKYNTIKY